MLSRLDKSDAALWDIIVVKYAFVILQHLLNGGGFEAMNNVDGQKMEWRLLCD